MDTLSPRAFADPLRAAIQARRSFGAHPLWRRIEAGGVDRAGLHRFAVQWFEPSTKQRWQERVRLAVETSLAHWWQFFDGIERDVGTASGRP